MGVMRLQSSNQAGLSLRSIFLQTTLEIANNAEYR